MARRRSSQPSQTALAFGVVALIALMLGAVLWLGGRQKRAREAELRQAQDEAARAEPEPRAQDADPFERLGPHPGRVAAAAKEAGGDAGGERPTPEPGALNGDEGWQEALEVASVAYARLQLATEAREQGDTDAERRFQREARERFSRALESTAAWYEEGVTPYDRRDLQVREIRNARARWADQIDRLRAALGE